MVYDPRMMGVKVNNTYQAKAWRKRLRRDLYRVRSGWCDVCGHWLHKRGFEVHEGIVTRRDVQGWRYPERAWIFTEFNCVLLCPTCHRPTPPSRQAVWDLQCKRYGEEAMKKWYYSLPFKVFPRRF